MNIQHAVTLSSPGLQWQPAEKNQNPQPENTDDYNPSIRDDGAALKPRKKWLFLNYIAADCNLATFQMGNIDNQEYVGSDLNTHIVAYVDVGHRPNPLDKTWSGARCYYINRDRTPRQLNSELISDFGDKVDMSNPETLTRFIVDAMKKFPSDYVALIMNDHGGGFTGGMADDSDGTFMSVPQMKKALADAEAITGKKIDIVGFDACLMAEAEVAYELRDNARILLASEESEGGDGWSYSTMLSQARTSAIEMLQDSLEKRIKVSPEDFAKIVVKVCSNYQVSIPTFSAVDLTKMNNLSKAVNDFAGSIIAYGQSNGIKMAFSQAEHYGENMLPYRDIHDLYHLADLVYHAVENPRIRESAEKVKKALNEAVIANESSKSTHPNSHGLSIYAPTRVGLMPGYGYNDLQFARDNEWDEAVTLTAHTPRPETGDVEEPEKSGSCEIPEYWPDGSLRNG